MHLIIVESPTKAKTLNKFLGKDYKVIASMGHVRDLPKDRLGIDVNRDFEPAYQVMADHKKLLAEIKADSERADQVILATDPDREGEAIAWHIQELLNQKSKARLAGGQARLPAPSDRGEPARQVKSQRSDFSAGRSKENIDAGKIVRITFHEITKTAIEQALKNPGQINLQLVNAQQARRVLDRLVGYKLSPLVWSKVRKGLSAGRVQSVALRIVVEREREIEKFKTEEYWSVDLQVKSEDEVGKSVDFELVEKNGERYEKSESFELYDGKYTVSKTTIATRDQVDLIINDIKKNIIYISDIEKKAVKKYPFAPFTTSTLQQEAGRKLGYSAKKTMQMAQRLYENGFITYHRTDSVNLASEAVFRVRTYIQNEFGAQFLPEAARFFKSKQKLAQEAHEAIRPTHPEQFAGEKTKIEEDIGRDAQRVYELIWKRFVACQMKEAEIERTTVLAVTSEKPLSDLGGLDDLDKQGYLFKTTGSVIVFPGFLKVYPEAMDEKNLPVFEKGEKISPFELLPVRHFTPPPPRYNEASLIATLEEKGIGRPSTYAPTISTIQDRQYVEKEEKKLKPTSLGIAVNDFLVVNFSDIDDMPFTAQMEDELDEIADGKREWVPMIKEFFTPFSEKIQSVYKTGERVKIQTEETDEVCNKCGAKMIVRIGRFGKFLACSKFPDCKNTKPLVLTLDLKCPDDGGNVVIKRTKRGKTFYGCSNYPNCKWASWNKPK